MVASAKPAEVMQIMGGDKVVVSLQKLRDCRSGLRASAAGAERNRREDYGN
jgi:hypothetical protein